VIEYFGRANAIKARAPEGPLLPNVTGRNGSKVCLALS